MRTKAIVDLGNLSDGEFFSKVAEGMKLCIRNATSFLRDVRWLARCHRNRSAGILTTMAHEEIAKYLILLDAVRCPRQAHEQRRDQLLNFNDHLAKGLYVLLYNRFPNTLAAVRLWAEEARATYYLDGPNDVDWIFYNAILNEREQSIYVDYIATDKGEGPSYWHRPNTLLPFIPGGGGVVYRQKAHIVASCLHAAGFSSPQALATVADTWRKEVFDDARGWDDLRTLNWETLCQLDSSGLLLRHSAAIICPIVNDWLFPLYNVKLSRKLSKEEKSIEENRLKGLRERRDKWSRPDQ